MLAEEHARRYAKLMGTVYGLVLTLEQLGRPITYAEIERIMSEQQHCSPTELMAVCLELHRFNEIIAQAEKG